ncbi:MAG: hypothetical protein N3F05_05050, partial [Candidatus Diapherotrites archaeon]|nr:hypothetical protein [Candidatus Diapherotrites archaeon]
MTYLSKHAYVLIGKESAYGTPVSCTKDVGKVQNITSDFNNNYRKIRGISSSDVQEFITGIFEASGSLEVKYQHGRLLEYIFGSVSHTQTTNDWKHTFTLTEALPSFTLEYGFDSATDSIMR